jgi:phospholipid/cholesterol/gamma-HCH transport system substrate-binding protein
VTRTGKLETAVGFFAVSGMILLVAIFFALLGKEHAFENRFQLIAVFDNVSGLKPGATVQLAGIDVGSVQAVRFSKENKAEVILEIRERFKERIYKNAVASIATMGLLGDKIIILTSGTSESGGATNGTVIGTQKYMEVTDFMDQVGPTFEDLQKVLKDMSAFLTSFDAPLKEFQKVLVSVGDIAEDVNAGRGTAGAVFKDPELYNKVVTLIDDADKTVNHLKVVADDIAVVSKDLPELAAAARKTMANVQKGSSKIVALADSGEDIAQDVKAASKDLPELMAKMNRATTNLETITENIKKASIELPELVEAGREGVEKGVELVEAARKSWLLRGSFAGETGQEPVPETLRDNNYSKGH